MGKIVILDENTSNQIAAGEVVERPASVVKELVENSIDAGSSNISIEINNGGVSLIKVVDNGNGIDEDDVEIAFERHSTSKIRRADDLESISTLGFRGEALASIASVSLVELTSRIKDRQYGKYIKIQGGIIKEVRQTGCPVGTTFIVRDLFYNTPARFKFLKKDTTEAGYISDMVNRIALGNQQISMKLINNRNSVIHTPGNNDLLSAIFSIYGKETAKEVLEVKYQDEKIEIYGYVGKPEIARANRNYQSIYINGRYVKNKTISSAIDEAYKTYLLKNKFAFVVLHIRINPLFVDVNVHPTKMEVRFSDEPAIFKAVYHAVNNALLSKSLIRNVEMKENPKNFFKFEENNFSAKGFVQEGLNVKPVLYEDGFTKAVPQSEVKFPINDLENKNIDTNFSSATADNKGVAFSQDIKVKTNEELNKEAENDINEAAKNVVNHETKNIVREEINQVHVKPNNEVINTKAFVNAVEEGDTKAIKEENKEGFIEERKERVLEEAIEEPKIESQEEKPDEDEKREPINADDRAKEANQLQAAKIIGQAFSTYILLQDGDNLILIDQHAAHERIMFEALKKKYKRNESLAQYLLSSVVIELTNQEVKIIEENREKLNRLGFAFENFGNNSIILRSIPVALADNASVKETFLDILDFLMSDKRKENILIEEEALYRVACKSAVKANKRLDDIEIKKIIKDLSNIENPYTCPHGRPTLIKITKYEFEKMFKRIV
ncbi:DNA mismatch repair endonuclease MutL [Acetivibrio cellulolyticus]|uniref:DNA mismatch repair endonuclease MutL n=1 Tax=Acetivibrio cellulolyticus TaxID=35830 RepID=UPI0002481C25|nr:DNA mismatch repair endonuclease MutL [Acetivibrio cellulolyticus]